MPLLKKVNPAKAAWAWCDTVDAANISDEHIQTAYRLDFPKCKPSACRRNCRTSPFCLSSLGESKWLSQTTDDSDDDDPLDLREPGTFVGLKNLGATCYVNSLLQLWFHNPEFREAMFLWNPQEDPTERALKAGGSKSNKSVVGHLQLLFILMEFGQQQTLDPKDFIHALNLEPSLQQDAQEFSKLFISLLEDTLKYQSNPKVKNFISNNFRGEYSYITRCSKCQKESISPSMFYELELNVKGHKSLQESLREFLREEKMEGVNMYSCSECMEKQEAIRFIRLEKLPPVLSLQLMRFIYDRKKGQKKKLNSFIQFPDSLDMTEFVPSGYNGPVLYNLSAVLIHRGPSAYSGHYIAHICDKGTSLWYKFNDETVEKMEGNKLKLNAGEEDEEGPRKAKQPRLAKGYLSSNNAYMLVYTVASGQCNVRQFSEESLPEGLKEDLEKHNNEYNEIISQSKEQKTLIKVNGQAQKEEIVTLWKALPVTSETEEWEAISTTWLSHWLANAKSVVEPIDNSKHLCHHNKLHPDATRGIKYINSFAGESLYEKYLGGPRLKGHDALCRECVTTRVKQIQMRNKIAEDAREISTLMKFPLLDTDRAFWVGKSSLKVWRRMASTKHLSKFDDQHGANGNDGEESDGETNGNDQCKNGTSGSCKETSDEDENRRDHSNANSPQSSPVKKASDPLLNGPSIDGPSNGSNGSSNDLKRKREPPARSDGDEGAEGKAEEDVDTLEEEFNEDLVCPHGCLTMQETTRRLVCKEIWTKLKSYFSSCKEFPRETKPCGTCMSLASEGEVTKESYKQQAQTQRELLYSLLSTRGRPKFVSGTYHAVSVPEFLNPWKKFIKENGRMEPLYSLRSSTLICVHGFLTINPFNDEDSDKLIPVTEDEWVILSSLYNSEPEITCTYGPRGQILLTSPRPCDECLAARMESEQQALLLYDKATIYIRQVTNQKPSTSSTVQDENDPPSPEVLFKPGAAGDASSLDQIRRSTRHRRVRGEKPVTVASTDTLRDLKIKILNSFGVPPFDQHLTLENGIELTDPDATLSFLNILPNTIILLKVDEPDDESSVPVEDYSRTSQVEEGFKGTLLLKR